MEILCLKYDHLVCKMFQTLSYYKYNSKKLLLMNSILIHIDGIFIFSRKFIYSILKKSIAIMSHDCYLKLTKYLFVIQSVKYLGYTASTRGVSPSQVNVVFIKELQKFTNKE